jgi:hypothetical protein
MGAVFWDFPMRASRKLSIAEDQAEEQAYLDQCERLIEAEEDKDESVVAGRSRGTTAEHMVHSAPRCENALTAYAPSWPSSSLSLSHERRASRRLPWPKTSRSGRPCSDPTRDSGPPLLSPRGRCPDPDPRSKLA